LNNKGFSLVELIVVIAIMAVLVAVLAPNLMKYIESSRLTTDKTNVKELYQAMISAAADESVTATADDFSYADGVITIKASNSFGKAVSENMDGKTTITLKSKYYKKGSKGEITFGMNDSGSVTITATNADSSDAAFSYPESATTATTEATS
jgi:type IV pilus assembly protein PilA